MSISELPPMFVPPQTKESQAQEAMDDLTRMFPMMACDDIEAMRRDFIDIKTLPENQRALQLRNKLSTKLHRLQTQGSVFGYPLVSDVAMHLYQIIQDKNAFYQKDLSTIQNDLNLLQRIVWKRISGNGGKLGQEILSQLT